MRQRLAQKILIQPPDLLVAVRLAHGAGPVDGKQPGPAFAGMLEVALVVAQVTAAVRRELLRGGQVFYVHNRVQDIASVAARVHMSTASFCRFFRRYFGMSFHAWLLDKKIETACYQLHVGTAPIQDIADRLGFHSASHFSMTFKRRMGITPGEYRRTARPGAQRQ